MSVRESDLDDAQEVLGVRFPSDYRALLLATDGIEELLPQAYLVLWPLTEVLRSNRDDQWHMRRDFAQLLFIGGDGAGELIALDFRSEQVGVVMVNAVSVDWEEVTFQAGSFSDFLSHLRAGGAYTF